MRFENLRDHSRRCEHDRVWSHHVDDEGWCPGGAKVTIDELISLMVREKVATALAGIDLGFGFEEEEARE